MALFRRWDRHDGPIPTAELNADLEALRIEPENLSDVIGFDEDRYRRTIVRSRPHYQALVFCWRSGQRSPIHDHRGSNCVLRVIRGRAMETRFDMTPCGRLSPAWSHELPEGTTTVRRGADIQQIGNFEAPGRDLITLHVYTPPPLSWRFYEVRETTFADHEKLLRKPARTVWLDLAEPAPARPMGAVVEGGAGDFHHPGLQAIPSGVAGR